MSVKPVKAGNIYSPPVVVLPPALTVCEIECIFIVIKKKKKLINCIYKVKNI